MTDYLHPAAKALLLTPFAAWQVLLSVVVAYLAARVTSGLLDKVVREGYASYGPLVGSVLASVWLLTASLTLLVTGLVGFSG